ncbi:MAG: hypothetical protein N3F64_06415 [Nitrososphaeria archaeon]|nr:hypothetical protein [Nitrososphaeria archaeon]
MQRKYLIALFIIILTSFIIIDTVQVTCPQCEGKGSIKSFSQPTVEIENVIAKYTTTACGYEWWDVTLYIKNNSDKNLTIRAYLTPFDAKANKTYSNIAWNIFIGPKESKTINGTITVPDFYGFQMHSDLKVSARLSYDNLGEEETVCPLCNGSGKVTILNFMKVYLSKR